MTQTAFDLNRSAITFDTLGYFDRLRAVGVPEPQAKVQTDALREIIEDKLATKQDAQELNRDLREVEVNLQTNIKELETRLLTNMKELETRLLTSMKELETRLQANMKELEGKLQANMKELQLRFQAEAQKNKYDLLKWQLGIGFALVVVMAKGFGWLGF